MTRRELILAHLNDHSWETSGEIGLVIGIKGGTLRALLVDMRNKGQLVSGERWAPYMGRYVNTWSIAPPGTEPSPEPVSSRERERRRERDREAKRRSRAKLGTEPQRRSRFEPLEVPASAPVPDLTGAACVGADPELFFSSREADIAEARALCIACPVRLRCAQWADANDEEFGVWAGEDRDARHLQVAS
jgi:hypothetical protein